MSETTPTASDDTSSPQDKPSSCPATSGPSDSHSPPPWAPGPPPKNPQTPYTGRKVISVSGDGGFGQYAMEFTTAVKYGMNLTHILFNNANLGKITKEQRAGEWPVWQTELVNPSFAKFAQNCGGVGITVEKADQLEDAITQALHITDGPSLVEIVTDQELI